MKKTSQENLLIELDSVEIKEINDLYHNGELTESIAKRYNISELDVYKYVIRQEELDRIADRTVPGGVTTRLYNCARNETGQSGELAIKLLSDKTDEELLQIPNFGQSCLVELRDLTDNCLDPIEMRQSKDGQWYFVVKARNNKVLATSEMYKTKQSCNKGIWSLRRVLND